MTDRLVEDLRRVVRDVGGQLSDVLDRTFGPQLPSEQTRPVVEDVDPARNAPGAGPLPDGAIPAAALETGTAFFSRVSGLSASGFAPRTPLSPGFVRAYDVAHDLATTLQPAYGIALGRTRGGLHIQECFADSFAILALARHIGSFSELEALVSYRDAKILTGNLTDWSGPAARAALKTAKALHDSGELAGKSTEDLLTLSAKLAKTHALPESALRIIIDRRGRILSNYGITTFSDDGVLAQDGRVSDPTGGVEVVELLTAALRSPDKPLKSAAVLIEKVISDLPTAVHMPQELRYPVARRAALEAYARDLEQCLTDAAVNPGLPEAIITRERQRTIEQGRRHEQWSPAERDGPLQSTSMTLQRLKVLDAVRMPPPPAPPDQPPPATPPATRMAPGRGMR